MPELYEKIYNKNTHFSFGKNWSKYLARLSTERIEAAKKSLRDFYDYHVQIKEKSYLDLGSGSGLFSLAAGLLGAKPVVSVDVDENSIRATSTLRKLSNQPSWWIIKQGSILDQSFVQSLGKFDAVYSWGVLHHTGNMWQALQNAITLVAPKGSFYLAIYNEKKGVQDSHFWLKIKHKYNHASWLGKRVIELLYLAEFCGIALRKIITRGPKFIVKYQSPRGMNIYHDMIDWLGGYPYEFSRPEPIIDFFRKSGFRLVKLNDVENNIGCNEYLFMRE